MLHSRHGPLGSDWCPRFVDLCGCLGHDGRALLLWWALASAWHDSLHQGQLAWHRDWRRASCWAHTSHSLRWHGKALGLDVTRGNHVRLLRLKVLGHRHWHPLDLAWMVWRVQAWTLLLLLVLVLLLWWL